MSGQTYKLSLSRQLGKPARQAFAIVEDLEKFPEFMPNVNAITVLESSKERKVAHWDTTIDDAPLDWVEEGLYDYDKLRLEFRSIEGVFDRFDGFWQVTPDREGSRVTFELEYEIGLPEIEEIIGPMLREKMIENVEGMLSAIEKRVEGLA